MIQNGFDICALHDNDGKFRNDDDGHQEVSRKSSISLLKSSKMSSMWYRGALRVMPLGSSLFVISFFSEPESDDISGIIIS